MEESSSRDRNSLSVDLAHMGLNLGRKPNIKPRPIKELLELSSDDESEDREHDFDKSEEGSFIVDELERDKVDDVKPTESALESSKVISDQLVTNLAGMKINSDKQNNESHSLEQLPKNVPIESTLPHGSSVNLSHVEETPVKHIQVVGNSRPNPCYSHKSLFTTPQNKIDVDCQKNYAPTPATIFAHWSQNSLQTPLQNQIPRLMEDLSTERSRSITSKPEPSKPHNLENKKVRRPLAETMMPIAAKKDPIQSFSFETRHNTIANSATPKIDALHRPAPIVNILELKENKNPNVNDINSDLPLKCSSIPNKDSIIARVSSNYSNQKRPEGIHEVPKEMPQLFSTIVKNDCQLFPTTIKTEPSQLFPTTAKNDQFNPTTIKTEPSQSFPTAAKNDLQFNPTTIKTEPSQLYAKTAKNDPTTVGNSSQLFPSTAKNDSLFHTTIKTDPPLFLISVKNDPQSFPTSAKNDPQLIPTSAKNDQLIPTSAKNDLQLFPTTVKNDSSLFSTIGKNNSQLFPIMKNDSQVKNEALSHFSIMKSEPQKFPIAINSDPPKVKIKVPSSFPLTANNEVFPVEKNELFLSMTKNETAKIIQVPLVFDQQFGEPHVINREIFIVNKTRYENNGLIGKGMSGQVYKVTNLSNNQYQAIKYINFANLDKEGRQACVDEIKMLHKLQAPCVIKMFDYEVTSSHAFVVMELGETDLSYLIKTTADEIDADITRTYWKQMLVAVNHIHKNGVIHSDLKPGNFVSVKGKLKIIDFGIASSINSDMTSVVKSSTTGTLNYISPEALTDIGESTGTVKHKINCKSDVWSLGCILYSMVYGYTPFHNIRAQYKKIYAIQDPKHKIDFPTKTNNLINVVPTMLIDVMKRCLNRDRQARPTVEELLQISHNPVSNSTPEQLKIPDHIFKILRTMSAEDRKQFLEFMEGRRQH